MVARFRLMWKCRMPKKCTCLKFPIQNQQDTGDYSIMLNIIYYGCGTTFATFYIQSTLRIPNSGTSVQLSPRRESNTVKGVPNHSGSMRSRYYEELTLRSCQRRADISDYQNRHFMYECTIYYTHRLSVEYRLKTVQIQF